jgi:hypothetical protein
MREPLVLPMRKSRLMLIRSPAARSDSSERAASAALARWAEQPIKHWLLLQVSVALTVWAVIIVGVHYIL